MVTKGAVQDALLDADELGRPRQLGEFLLKTLSRGQPFLGGHPDRAAGVGLRLEDTPRTLDDLDPLIELLMLQPRQHTGEGQERLALSGRQLGGTLRDNIGLANLDEMVAAHPRAPSESG